MGVFSFLLKSSIGKKIIMGLTGLFLIVFLVVHCGVNALIFMNDGGVLFNEAAEFMATNILIRTMEIVLFLGILVHIFQGLYLVFENKKARPVQYSMTNGKANSKWYSRSMGLLGTLLLIFLIIHLRHFWYVSRLTDELNINETLFDEMKEVFTIPWVIAVYLLGMISLSYHLMHGFQSAFQTMGWNHKKYTPIIKAIGFWYSIIIPLIFSLMPIAMHLGWIK